MSSWRCFHAAPAQPGTRVEVSWFEQRYQGGVLETAELDEGETGPLATRLAYRRVGDHLEADTTTSLADPTDPTDHAVVTVAHFVPAPCDTADAMLAKH